jgi:ABC-type transport system substrate-binding protein
MLIAIGLPLVTGKNMHLKYRTLLRLVVSLVMFSIAPVAQSSTLDVVGWGPAAQVKLNKNPPSWLADDAIIGRLACPALVRLEGDQLKNDALLLKSNPVVERVGSGERWTLTLRPGLRWWSGAPIDANSLVTWLKKELPETVSEKLGMKFPSDVEISAAGPLTVKVEWEAPPAFGPYILSGVSLVKSASNNGFECAGLYSMTSSPDGVNLFLNKGYSAKYEKIHVFSNNSSKAASPIKLKFSMAAQASKAATTSIVTSACTMKIDVPLFTALIWNPASPMSSSALLRQALTMATPRGEILRTAAGDIGSLVSAPILRSHPGYNSKTLVRPYNLESSSQIFEQAGFRQGHIGLPRAKTADKPVLIQIARMSGRQDLVEKMISDSFASLGIETQFDDVSAQNQKFDAALASVFIPWTSQDLRPVAHTASIKSGSNSDAPFPFEVIGDKKLDEALDQYSLSLTRQDADFGLLRKVQEKWFEVEPWTVVMAHQYCVEAKGIALPKKINALDSDWFRRLTVD